MRYASICSGIGSCRLASEGFDWECAFFAEIEPFPSAVLAHHFPEVPNHGDFTQIGESAGPVDLLVGGTPCQSFSVAGKRAGLDSPNGNLAIEFARLAQRLRARWIVWENVPGVLSSVSDDGSSDFDTFLGVLESVGYSVAWTVLDAQHFGVPQRRRRVFVVGYLGDWRPPAAVLFESDCLRGDSAPSYETREDVAGTPGGGTGERGWAPDTDRMTFVPVTANSINARDGKGSDPGRSVGNDVAHALDAYSAGRATEDGTGRGTPLVPFLADPIGANEGRTYSNAGNNPRLHNVVPVAFSCKDSGDDAGELSPTLRSLDFDKSHANGGGQVAVAFQEAQTGVREYANAGTLRANGPGHDPVGTRIRSGMSARRLTPRECEALQGLPRDWTLVPYRGKPAKDAPRYRAIGNGWAVPVVSWIFSPARSRGPDAYGTISPRSRIQRTTSSVVSGEDVTLHPTPPPCPPSHEYAAVDPPMTIATARQIVVKSFITTSAAGFQTGAL